MPPFPALVASRTSLAPLAGALLCLAAASPCLAEDEADSAPKGAAVTVLKATKSCFDAISSRFRGSVIAREETAVRPDRPGLKVAEILAEAGDTVTAGQTLARLTLPEGGIAQVQAPVAGLVASFLGGDRRGGLGQGRGAVLHHRAQRIRPGRAGPGPRHRQARRSTRRRGSRSSAPARSTARCAGWRSTVEPNSQLGQVFDRGHRRTERLLVNSSGRALIKTGQSCGVSVPLTAVLYGTAGTVVQVVRRARVETRRVEVGLMSGGQVEIRDGLTEGDVVVAPRRRAAARRRSGAGR